MDHQSSKFLFNFLLHKNISIEEFLTNKKYIIIIDGDEYGISTHLINSGIINVEEPLFKEGEFSYVK